MSKVSEHKKTNNFAFIDSQNLNLGIRALGWKLDYRKFRTYLKDKYGVTSAFLFIGQVPGNEMMYASLQKAGYILIFKPTLTFGKSEERQTKGNVDAELVLHAMIEYTNYDKAIIVSGDGDFYCLIEYLVEKDKLQKILVPNHRYSSLLRKFAATYISQVSSLKGKVEFKK